MSVSPVCSCLSCPTHAEAGRPAACGFYPSSSLTDAQWALLEPLLPPPGNAGGRGGRSEKHPRRRGVGAVFFLVRGGIARGALPAGVSPAQNRFRIFPPRAGPRAWAPVHHALRGPGPPPARGPPD